MRPDPIRPDGRRSKGGKTSQWSCFDRVVTGHVALRPCHGHEAPLATHLVEPAQQELAESEDRFDDAEHWFRDLFTQRIELPAFWRFQPMRHGLDRRWVFRRGRWMAKRSARGG